MVGRNGEGPRVQVEQAATSASWQRGACKRSVAVKIARLSSFSIEPLSYHFCTLFCRSSRVSLSCRPARLSTSGPPPSSSSRPPPLAVIDQQNRERALAPDA